ncbi:MAG: hypothetical protein ABI402_07785 [Ferruginibacter sp.]
MITINLLSFKGNNFHDLYIFIMKNPAISYKLIIPRHKNNSQSDPHFINNMEFACAAYAFQLLSGICTDFSYTVPSAYKLKPFECCIETTEPEKLVDIIYRLLCAYNPNFGTALDEDFYFEAAQYYRKVVEGGRMDIAAYGLMAVAWEELDLWMGTLAISEE